MLAGLKPSNQLPNIISLGPLIIVINTEKTDQPALPCSRIKKAAHAGGLEPGPPRPPPSPHTGLMERCPSLLRCFKICTGCLVRLQRSQLAAPASLCTQTQTPHGILWSPKKEILPHDVTWMNLEDIMPSEISQSQKDKYCIFPLIRGS